MCVKQARARGRGAAALRLIACILLCFLHGYEAACRFAMRSEAMTGYQRFFTWVGVKRAMRQIRT